MDKDGWEQWGRHVLAELERLNDNDANLALSNQKILDRVNSLDKKLVALSAKSITWGSVGALIIVMLTNAKDLLKIFQ